MEAARLMEKNAHAYVYVKIDINIGLCNVAHIDVFMECLSCTDTIPF